MQEHVELMRETELQRAPVTEPMELPIPVVPDWEERVRKATAMMKLIDRHLDYEERGRRMLPNERLMPNGLCPEQRVNLITDMHAVTR